VSKILFLIGMPLASLSSIAPVWLKTKSLSLLDSMWAIVKIRLEKARGVRGFDNGIYLYTKYIGGYGNVNADDYKDR
jgi:hypothetical protein